MQQLARLRLNSSTWLSLLVFILCSIISYPVFGENAPPNSQTNIYGTGWVCQRGFYRSGNQCLKVEIPANAQLDIYGTGWTCQRGFRLERGICQEVVIPQNAQLDIYGTGWTCQRGFHIENGGCTKVIIPPNAQLDIYGTGWICQRGFKLEEGICRAVQIPANAQLDVFGTGWICQRGFYAQENECRKVLLPNNAQLDIFGTGWQCNQNFKKQDNNCVPMSNAELQEQAEAQKRAILAANAYRLSLKSREVCETEDKTGAQICVSLASADLDCDKYIGEEKFSSCEAVIKYEIRTDYKGNSSINTDIKCEGEVSYSGGYSGSSSEYKRKSHTLYREGNDSDRVRLDFSFSSYQEVISVKITDARCKIESVSLY